MVSGWCTLCQSHTESCVAFNAHKGAGKHRWRSYFRLGGRNGKQIAKIHKVEITKKEAEKWEHITIGDYERGTYLPRTHKAILFSELADKYYREHSLQANRNAHLHTKYRIEQAKSYLGNRIARDIKRNELKEIRSKMRESGLAASTVNRFFNDLRAIFYWGMSEELVDKNPCEFISKLEENDVKPQFATQDEINRVRRAAQNLKVRQRAEICRQRLMDTITTLLHTGARPESMRLCRWENGDVDFTPIKGIKDGQEVTASYGTIWFTTYKGRKKHRYPHPIDDVMYELLMRRSSLTGRKGPVFDMTNVTRHGTMAIKASGINDNRPEELKFTLYGLKHCYASQLLMSGATLDEVRRLLGHTDMKMVVKHYGHLTQEYLAKVSGKINLTPHMEPNDESNTVESNRRAGDDKATPN